MTPMSILAARLQVVAERLAEDVGAEPSVVAELRELTELATGLDPYLSRWTTPESAALKLLDARTGAEDWSRHSGSAVIGDAAIGDAVIRDAAIGHLEQEMLSGHVEGQTLKMLVHATRATRVLDIGMFTGYSALAMAEALPADGIVVACEIDADVAAFAQRCFAESTSGHQIDVRVGPALRTLQELADTGTVFDLVFIDADKACYAAYLDAVLGTGLLAPHGVICADNTLMQGQPWLPGASTDNGVAIAEFNQKVAADPRVEQVIIPLRDGLTLIRQVGVG